MFSQLLACTVSHIRYIIKLIVHPVYERLDCSTICFSNDALMRQPHKCASGVTARPLVSSQDHDYLNSRKRGISKRLTRDLPLVKLLNISITLSPFLGVDTTQFHASLTDGTEDYWLSLPANPQGQLVRSGCGGLSLCMSHGGYCDKVLL